jgi:hypothetical protein
MSELKLRPPKADPSPAKNAGIPFDFAQGRRDDTRRGEQVPGYGRETTRFYAAWRPRAALAVDTGEPEWSAYSGALGRKFLGLDQFLKSTSAKAEENVPHPRLFP